MLKASVQSDWPRSWIAPAVAFLALMSGSVVGAEAAQAPGPTRELRDVTQTTIKRVERPQRVVTLAPSLAEIAADVVGEDLERIVGVTEYTDYPPVLKKTASVGPYSRLNLEKITALKPDLVLATTDGNAKDQIDHLRELGLPVVAVNTGSFAEISRSIELVAQALGAAEEGKRMSAQLSQGIERFRARAVQAQSSGRKPIRVMLQVGDEPVVVMGGQSFLNETLKTVGAINAYEDQAVNYLKPSNEDVLRRKPDLILIISLGEDLAAYRKMAKRWETLKLPVKVIRADALIRPSLRLLEGLGILEKAVYGPAQR